MSDPFFEVIHDGEWNACIGVQGSETNYVEGYLQAARILSDTLIEKELMGSRDTLVMPILYNVRHGLELALKYAVDRLSGIGLIPVREGTADHHILSYWRHLNDADVPDRQFRELLASIEPFVRSLSRVDADGQELRYFTRQDGMRSLEDLAVVNLPHVRDSVEHLAGLLVDLQERVAILRDEHGTRTRTTRCSRTDLLEITDMIGPHPNWSEDSFLDRKAAVMERFGLTRKAFSNAIDAIRASRPLAARVGLETKLVHLRDEQAVELARDWLAVFPPPPHDFVPRVINPAKLDPRKIDAYMVKVRELVTKTERGMSLEEFADVQTMFYIGRDRVHGEYYEAALGETIEQLRLQPRSRRIRDIVSKTNMLDGLIDGLRQVGRPSLADRLEVMREAARPVSGDGARSP